jgi:hypothetical protein
MASSDKSNSFTCIEVGFKAVSSGGKSCKDGSMAFLELMCKRSSMLGLSHCLWDCFALVNGL